MVEDQLSLAIGKRGQNVRLAARLTGWDIDISTPADYNKGLDDLEKVLKQIEDVTDVMLDKLLAMGIISLTDIQDVGAEPLVNMDPKKYKFSDIAITEIAEGLIKIEGMEQG